MPVIRISDTVFRELQLRAVGLEDTPDSTLRQILGIPTEGKGRKLMSIFELMQAYLATQSRTVKADTMQEIKHRFETFGWMLPAKHKNKSGRKKN